MGAVALSDERNRRVAIGVSVAASLIFWVAIKLSKTYDTTEAVEVTYQLPVGYAFAEPPLRRFAIDLGGTGWQLLAASLREGDVTVAFDSTEIKNAPDGYLSVRAKVAEALERDARTVRSFGAERVPVRTERMQSRRVAVELQGTLSYGLGYLSTEGAQVSPDSVTVTGPASVLDALESWPTDTFTIAGIRDTASRRVPLLVSDSLDVRVTPPSVRVRVAAQQFTEKGLYVPVVARGVAPGDSVTLFPARVLVTAAVALDNYGALRPESFAVVAELPRGQLPRDGRLPVRLVRAPDYVRTVRIEPRVVEAYRVAE